MLHNTLTVELEDSFVVIEELALDAPEAEIKLLLSSFADECIFIGETLELPWLGEAITPIVEILEEADVVEALLVTQDIISQLNHTPY